MTSFMHDVAGASLPVAIGLLISAAIAAGALWSGAGDDQLQRTARMYVEPLSTWCLIALALHTLALGAAGDAGLRSLALPLVLGVAAMALRGVPQAAPRPAAPAPRPAPAPAPAVTPTPTPTPDRSLWADPADEAGARRGLWSRT